jgi:hypothetical protein
MLFFQVGLPIAVGFLAMVVISIWGFGISSHSVRSHLERFGVHVNDRLDRIDAILDRIDRLAGHAKD